MANQNKNSFFKACEVLGFNPDEYLLTFGQGKSNKNQITSVNGKSTSVIASFAEWLQWLQDNSNMSMARSKVEQAHTHARCQENICDDIIRMQNWQDQNATYAKKSSYNYTRLAYPELMQKVFDDYAVSMHNYCVVKNENTFIKDDLIIPIETLRQFTKLWLSENKCFEKYQNKIDFAIKTYASKTNWILA